MHLMVRLVLLLVCLGAVLVEAQEADTDDFRIALDLSATQAGLTTYKGYQNDISASAKFKYRNFPMQPFVRAVSTNYYYLVEGLTPNPTYTSQRRTALGVGLDLFLNRHIRLRYISDYINNQTTNSNYQQDAFLLIYNQYIDLQVIQINNYLESAMIPRYSKSKFSTYFRSQLLKTIDIDRTLERSHVVYPFVQMRIRENDEEIFGKSGNSETVGLGYKYYARHDLFRSLAFLVEGHSVVYQSSDFNGDWTQILAVIQYNYK